MIERNEWAGQTALILGGGPSMNDFTVNDLQQFNTIGINQTSRRMDPDIVTLFDSPAHMGEGMKPALRSLFGRSRICLAKIYANLWLTYAKDKSLCSSVEWWPAEKWNHWDVDTYRETVEGWEDGDVKQLPYGPTSMSSAVWLAAFMGVTRIGLVGLDLGPKYFFESVKPFACPQGMDGIATFHWRQLRDMLAKLCPEVEVYNLSEQSRLPAEAVPYARLPDWLRES